MATTETDLVKSTCIGDYTIESDNLTDLINTPVRHMVHVETLSSRQGISAGDNDVPSVSQTFNSSPDAIPSCSQPLGQFDYTFDFEECLSALRANQNKPKDVLIEVICECTRNNILHLEEMKHDLFKLCCNIEEFPIRDGILRKRKSARTPGADSLEFKLARDCFVLFRASCGEFTEALYEVVAKSKRCESNLNLNRVNRSSTGIYRCQLRNC